MSTLSSLNVAKYAEYLADLANKRRRNAELHENDLVKINTQMGQWLLGAVSGDQDMMNTAIDALEVIYDETIAPPANVIGATTTEYNTRRGVGVSVSIGSNAITFSSVFTASTYSLSVMAYTTAGNPIAVKANPALRTVSGFTIEVPAAGKIDYIAILN